MPDPKPDPKAKATDIGPCPGDQFVKIEWVKPVADEAVGAVEWCEHRRAAGLERDGYAKVVKEEKPTV